MAERKQLQLQCRLEPGTPEYVRTDPTRLRQILLNLLGNAFKFTDTGGVYLRVQAIGPRPTEETGEHLLRFEIRDTGIGISKRAQQDLFQAFRQADASTHRQYGGTGLGLSICRQLCELMGGDIGVHSEPGQGSTFWFSIRCGRADDSFVQSQRRGSVTSAAPVATAPQPAFTQRHILVAEDNAVNQLVVSGMLKKLGASFDVVGDGQAALDTLMARHDEFDLVLMDCEMPVLDGYDATTQLRRFEQQQALQPLPVIALTAHVMYEHQLKAQQAGMNAQLSKPLELVALRQLLQQQLGESPAAATG
jgi:CheY-like chemotaxis protein